MRTVTHLISPTNPFPIRGTLAGPAGEHLMTQLIISLPEEMGLLKLNIIASPSAGMATRSAF